MSPLLRTPVINLTRKWTLINGVLAQKRVGFAGTSVTSRRLANVIMLNIGNKITKPKTFAVHHDYNIVFCFLNMF